jgi:hypothetical protein
MEYFMTGGSWMPSPSRSCLHQSGGDQLSSRLGHFHLCVTRCWKSREVGGWRTAKDRGIANIKCGIWEEVLKIQLLGPVTYCLMPHCPDFERGLKWKAPTKQVLRGLDRKFSGLGTPQQPITLKEQSCNMLLTNSIQSGSNATSHILLSVLVKTWRGPKSTVSSIWKKLEKTRGGYYEISGS